MARVVRARCASGEASSARRVERGASRSTRRAVLVGKTALALGEAVVFPALTESATRPRVDAEALALGSWEWVRSLFPATRDPVAMAAAKAALEAGEEALAAGDARSAVASLERVEALVPREYKMNQRAWLALSRAHELAGDRAKFLEYKARRLTVDARDARHRADTRLTRHARSLAQDKTWWWGRGLRWPGWYIIAYLSARSAYFDAKEETATFTMREAMLLAPLWIGGLFLLVEYGLPDY